MDLKPPETLTFTDFITLAADPKRIQEYILKLESLADEIAMQRAINSTLEEATALKERAATDRGEAARALTEARDEADYLKVQASSLLQSARQEEADLLAHLESEKGTFQASRKVALDEIATLQQEIDLQNTVLQAAQARLLEKNAWVERMQKEYGDKLAALKAITG